MMMNILPLPHPYHSSLLPLPPISRLKPISPHQTIKLRSTVIVSKLNPAEKYLSAMGFESSSFGQIFDKHPKLLTCDPHLDLYPLFAFFLNVHLPYQDILSYTSVSQIVGSQCRMSIETYIEIFVDAKVDQSYHSPKWKMTPLLVESVGVTLFSSIAYFLDEGFKSPQLLRMANHGLSLPLRVMLTFPIWMPN